MLIDIYGRVATDLRVSLTDVGEHPAPHVPHAGRGPAVAGQARPAHRRRGRRAGPDRGHPTRRGGGPLHRRRAAAAPRPRRDRRAVRRPRIASCRLHGPARRDRRHDVLQGLAAARAAGLTPVKVNAVLMPERNADEAPELLAWAMENDYGLRFVEQMPLDAQHGRRRDGMITAGDIRESLSIRFTLTSEPHEARGSAPTGRRLVDGGPARSASSPPSPAPSAAPATAPGSPPTAGVHLPVRTGGVRPARGVALRGAGRGDRGAGSARRGEEGRLRPRRAVFPPARPPDVGHRRLTPRA